MGPLTRQQLLEHLGMQHLSDYFNQPQFGDYIAALPFLGKKIIGKLHNIDCQHEYSLFHILEKQKKGKDACPIRECDFRLSFDEPIMEYHIDGHDLMDRIKSHKDIRRVYPNYRYSWGPLTCPMCGKKISGHYISGYILYRHFRHDHSREERLRSAGILEFCQAISTVRELMDYSYFGEIIRDQEEVTGKALGILAAE